VATTDTLARVSSVKRKVRGTKKPLAKFGTVVATVALRLVPNYSAATVTKIAQYPIPKPMKPQTV
jgi:hypothetical protein